MPATARVWIGSVHVCVMGSVVAPIGVHRAEAATIFTAIDLGTLGGTSSGSIAINGAGQVAGYSNPTGSTDQHAFRWDPIDGMVDLGTLGGSYSIPIAMNDAGVVVGRSPIATGESHGFVWDEVNGLVDIGTLGGDGETSPAAINAAGTVVGSSTFSGSLTHAFVWDAVNGLVDIGTLGGTQSGAYGINDDGDVVGWSLTAGDTAGRGFIWNSIDGMTDIGSGTPLVINDADQVGGKFVPPGGVAHAFRWTSTEGMVDLGTTSGYVYDIAGISDDGEVAGFGFDPYTSARGFVANPIDGFTEIDSEGPVVVASDINASGLVVGSSKGPDVDHAFVYRRGAGVHLLPGGSFGASGVAINDSGEVAGHMFVGGFLTSHAVKWVTTSAPTVSIANAAVVEGDANNTRTVQFSVTLSDPTTTTVSVPYSVRTSSNQNAATATADFRTKSGTITFKPSATTTKYASAVVNVDATAESDEHFIVELGTPTGGYSLGTSVVTATILDDDPPPGTPAASVGDGAVWEGDTGTKNMVKLWVTLNAPSVTTTTVQVTVAGGTATTPGDAKAFVKTLTFTPGQFKKPVVVTVYPDASAEIDETMVVSLASPTGGLMLDRATGTVTILNDD